jgi:hypothetical protein
MLNRIANHIILPNTRINLSMITAAKDNYPFSIFEINPSEL